MSCSFSEGNIRQHSAKKRMPSERCSIVSSSKHFVQTRHHCCCKNRIWQNPYQLAISLMNMVRVGSAVELVPAIMDSWRVTKRQQKLHEGVLTGKAICLWRLDGKTCCNSHFIPGQVKTKVSPMKRPVMSYKAKRITQRF